MKTEIRELLEQQFTHCQNWQAKHGIAVQMTFEDYLTLWTPYRIRTLEKKLAKHPDALRAFMNNPVLKPVCSWVSREARLSGVMTRDNARICTAMESRRLFQFKKGDTHRPESIEKMRKPKSDETKAKMAEKRRAYWATRRNNPEGPIT